MTEYIPKEELDDLTSSSSSSSSSNNIFLILCNTIAPFTSIGMFLSPIPTIRNIVKTGTVGDLPLLPYTSMITSCFVWIIYGLIQHQPIVYFTNLIEFILSIYYFIEFTNYAPQYSITFPGSVYNHIHFTIFIWCITIVISIFFSKSSKRRAKRTMGFCSALHSMEYSESPCAMENLLEIVLPLDMSLCTSKCLGLTSFNVANFRGSFVNVADTRNLRN